MDELVSKAKGAVDLARHETADDGFADDHQGHLVAAVAHIFRERRRVSLASEIRLGHLASLAPGRAEDFHGPLLARCLCDARCRRRLFWRIGQFVWRYGEVGVLG
jgi:hypothetical protein